MIGVVRLEVVHGASENGRVFCRYNMKMAYRRVATDVPADAPFDDRMATVGNDLTST
jgi:hypothetical protein